MEIRILQTLSQGFKQIDQNSGAKDGSIDLNVFAVSKEGTQVINPEFSKTMKLIVSTFGLNEKSNQAQKELVYYFDELDGKSDELINLSEFEKFVKTLPQKPNQKDKLIQFLKGRVQSYQATLNSLKTDTTPDVGQISLNEITLENLDKMIKKLEPIKPGTK